MKSYLTWHGLADPVWLTTLGLVGLAAAGLIIWLYRYERSLIARPLGWTLLGLRIAVVVVILVALLEPVWISEIDRQRTGRILLAVDVSDSMDTVDLHADRAEKLRWARALGILGNADINPRLDRWQAALDAQREPDWVDPEESPDPLRRQQIAQARRENLDEVFLRLSQLSRREMARRLLLAGQTPLINRLADLGLLEVSLFAGQSTAVDPDELDARLSRAESTLLSERTDLAQPFNALAGAQSDIPIAGVVLITDGRHNALESDNRLLARLAGISAPVYPVLIGSEQRPRDLAFSTLDYPRQPVSQNDKVLVRVALRTAGYEGQEVNVTLSPEADAPGEPQTRTAHVVGPVTELQFSLDAPQLGRFRYTLTTPVQPGETRDDNNSRSIMLTVVDDQADVLVLDGEGRWEFRFLDNALRRDEQVEVQEILFRQPYMGVLPETFFPRQLKVPPPGSPADQSPFSPFDLIIVGDVGPHQWPSGAWEWLDRFVREEGGTLVLQAGKRHLPLGYDRNTILESLLPVTGLRTLHRTGRAEEAPPTERGFRPTLTPDGQSEPFLRLADTPQENERIWSELPGQTWGLVGEAKGEATVLAAVLPDGAKRTLETERENAIIVRQQVGYGQVLWIGFDGTWRWRHRIGDQYHHRFWGQLARWGARFKAIAKNEFVAFGPIQPAIELGEEALFRASWNRNFLQRFPNLKARGVISRLDDPQHTQVQTFDLTPAAGPLDFEGRAAGLPPGEYRVQLEVDSADLGGHQVVAELQVQEPATSELSDISANRALLETMAEFTGGRLLLPHELAELPQIFRGVSDTISLRSEHSLWDSWLLLLTLFALLTAEWVLRKLNGLP